MVSEKKKGVLVLGAKENFLVRALVSKLKEADYDAEFAKAGVDSINSRWDKTDVVVYYIDADETLDSRTLTFLKDRLDEADDKKLVAVGDRGDLDRFYRMAGSEVVARTFLRPLNANDLISYLDTESKKDETTVKKEILIVDDDPTYMELVRSWLKGKYRVSMANSGVQAISFLAKNRADLILLDFEMPIVTGPQVLEMLRSESDTKSIPVIFLTGRSDKQSVMRVLELKPEGYLLKTIKKEELLSQLDTFFEKGKLK